jgi:HAD superfamily hydrolase (TIGR01509 family)
VKVRAVLFDYGHTLVNFSPAEENLLACYEEVRREILAEIVEEAPQAAKLVDGISRRVQRLVHESYERRDLEEIDIVEHFADALAGLGLGLDEGIPYSIAEREHRALMGSLEMLPGNRAVLRQLKDWNLELGLISNAHFLPKLMREDMDRLGIAEFMEAMVFSAEVKLRKPHPGIFLHLLRELDILPEQAVFVGDRVRDDIGGAKALGMGAVLTREFRQETLDGHEILPDAIIDTLPGILEYVRQRM